MKLDVRFEFIICMRRRRVSIGNTMVFETSPAIIPEDARSGWDQGWDSFFSHRMFTDSYVRNMVAVDKVTVVIAVEIPVKKPRNPSVCIVSLQTSIKRVPVIFLSATSLVRSKSNGYDAPELVTPVRAPTTRLWTCCESVSGHLLDTMLLKPV